ncbi:MAG: hypothetical protein ACREUK_12680 [Burkholderiales bacterium]
MRISEARSHSLRGEA